MLREDFIPLFVMRMAWNDLIFNFQSYFINCSFYILQDEVGVFCVPLPDFLALNFPSPSRVSQNGILVHPTIENNQNQRQITVHRIGRDARPLLPCEISRYQHMFTNRQENRNENTNSRLRNLAQRIPRLNPVNPDFRVIPWSERPRVDRLDQDYVLRLPVLDISRINVNNNRIMNPAPVHTVNPEAVVNNPRPNDTDLEYNWFDHFNI